MRWPFLKSRRRRRQRQAMVRVLRAKYDAAQTTAENRRHWANADELSPVAALGGDVRRIIRSRARYEVANNSIARGIVLTLGNDLVGTGPRLQMLSNDKQVNSSVEAQFGSWAAEINLAAKLRTMRMARAQDGEAFGVMFTNRGLRGPVKLDLKLIEADRIGTPNYPWSSQTLSGRADENKAVDGIVFDEWGNPAEYHVLKRHPGAADSTTALAEYDRIPAAGVVHWFRPDRPGQRRGLPDIAPALPLFAVLRRYTKATLAAAETAADFSLVMKTTAPAGGEAAEVDPWETMELERNIAMFAPEGWEPHQMKAEHPAATFAEFRKAIINEIARCLNMPLNVAACDSSGYNYASGRLDHQTYYRSIDVEREDLGAVVLDPLLTSWMSEAILISDLLPLSARMLLKGLVARAHQWFWRGHEHVDPLKEAKGSDTLLQAGLLTEAEFYARKGLDWEEQQEQRKREAEGRESRGLPHPQKKETGLAAVGDLSERVEDLQDAVSERA